MRIFLGLSVLVLSLGCRESFDVSGGSTGTGGSTGPIGEVDDNAGFRIYFYEGEENSGTQKYSLHKAGTDFSSPCVVRQSDTAIADRDISCILDMPEEDLHVQGVKLQYNIPSDMCEYLYFRPYHFFNYDSSLTSTTPTFLYYDIDADGDLGVDTNDDGDVDTPTLPAGLNGVNPQCPTDFSDSGGPNCCVGSYTLRRRVWDPDRGAGGSYETTTTTEDWGGNLASCLHGPAMDTQELTQDGYPMTDVTYVEGTGLNKVYEPPTPISKGVGTIYLANWYDPTEHSNLIGSTTYTMPKALIFGQSSYEWVCYQRGRDARARIRLYVREWNEYSEWEQGASGDYDSGTGQSETEFPDLWLNDFWDWLDYKASGVDYFPQLPKL